MTAIAREDAPLEFHADVAEARTAQAGNFTIAFESLRAGVETALLFQGLPDDACQSPHWGYLVSGKFRVLGTDGSEELVRAGQAYYLPPGHNIVIEEDAELVEFSPTDKRQETMQHVATRMEAARV